MQQATLNTEQKLMAMKALAGDENCHIWMLKPGQWFISLRLWEIPRNGMLSSTMAGGKNIEEAINHLWDEITNSEYIVFHAYREGRRHVKWNGFMWVDV